MTQDVDIVRPNHNAWKNAFWAAVPAYVVVLVLLLPRYPGARAFNAGRFLFPTIVAAAVVGALAARSKRRWRWWSYLAAASVLAVLVTGLLEVRNGALANHAGLERKTGSVLFVPERAAGWNLVDNSAARHREDQSLSTIEEFVGDDVSAVYGEYRSGAGRVAFVGLNSRFGSEYRADLQRSPRAGVRNLLAGAGVTSPTFVDSGEPNVAMACAEPDQPQLRGPPSSPAGSAVT